MTANQCRFSSVEMTTAPTAVCILFCQADSEEITFAKYGSNETPSQINNQNEECVNFIEPDLRPSPYGEKQWAFENLELVSEEEVVSVKFKIPVTPNNVQEGTFQTLQQTHL